MQNRKEVKLLEIIGISYSTTSQGVKNTTLHVIDDFPLYYKNEAAEAAGRGCMGRKVETIYIGSYDTKDLEIGAEIEIYYDKAIKTANGTYQPIKKIEIL